MYLVEGSVCATFCSPGKFLGVPQGTGWRTKLCCQPLRAYAQGGSSACILATYLSTTTPCNSAAFSLQHLTTMLLFALSLSLSLWKDKLFSKILNFQHRIVTVKTLSLGAAMPEVSSF
jgi:hypothetical protein